MLSRELAVELFKLRVENLGRIKQAELGIRPLTVFIGPNNTNKTWTAYALYALAQRLCALPAYASSPTFSPAAELVEVDSQLQSAVEAQSARFRSLLAQGAEASTVVDAVDRSTMLKGLSYPLRFGIGAKGIGRVLGMSGEDLNQARVTLEVDDRQFSEAPWDRVEFTFRREEPSFFQALVRGRDGRSATQVASGVLSEDRLIREYVGPAIGCGLWGAFSKVVCLPAERKGLVFLGELIDEGFLQYLGVPVRTFCILVLHLLLRSGAGNEGGLGADLSGLVEERMLEGSVDFEQVAGTGTGGGPLYFYPNDGPALPIPAASSLVRALAVLDLYLKFVAEPGDLIVIDEPEMNAHPQAQLMIAELLAIMVNKGIRVVVSTHSPYIVDHLNNLIEAATLSPSKQSQILPRFSLGTSEAFLPSEKVAAYEFGVDGHVTDAFTSGHRINWGTFGEVSDRVGNLYGDILEVASQE
jgi:hypothetical protein